MSSASTNQIAFRLAALAFSALLLGGCGDGGDATKVEDGATSTTAATGDTPDLSDAEWTDLTDKDVVTVQARDNIFVKPYIEVRAGTTVTFNNRGRNQHNVLAVPEDRFESIEAEELEPGMKQEVTFTAPGDYPYYCSLHGTATKGMVGAIRVVE
ncbi:MAG: cupredoxin domain-containing protein [Microthrixaceae bacterium]|jgi:plastocyanin|nr:cupredoxin domain-containing protein [Microthrixaceae bacterium]